MAKEVQYNSDYVDGHMRSLKIEDETLALRVGKDKAKFTGDLQIEGNVPELKTEDLRVYKHGSLFLAVNPSAKTFTFYGLEADDYFRILVGNNGSATLTTNDADSTTADMNLNANGDINLTTDKDIVLDADEDVTLDAGTGFFRMQKGGTEFSPTNSAYAGMILGYTKIQNDGTAAADNSIVIGTSMTVLQTNHSTDVSITFTAPPSGNVEIELRAYVAGSSKTVDFALSDNSTFNEINEVYTYDNGAHYMDETDRNITTIPFAVTGLTAGTSYTYYIGASASTASAYIYHGRFRTTGTHYPPILVKAVALPTTITTGE